MSTPSRLALCRCIADAVTAVHVAGVLHGDLQPANIFVATHRDGPHVRLSGFGPWQAGRRIHGIFTLLGARMRHRRRVTARGDVYSLGLILYQIVCGDIHKWITPGWERDVPANLRKEIASATDRNPARRMSSARQLALRLQGLVAEVPDGIGI